MEGSTFIDRTVREGIGSRGLGTAACVSGLSAARRCRSAVRSVHDPIEHPTG